MGFNILVGSVIDVFMSTVSVGPGSQLRRCAKISMERANLDSQSPTKRIESTSSYPRAHPMSFSFGAHYLSRFVDIGIIMSKASISTLEGMKPYTLPSRSYKHRLANIMCCGITACKLDVKRMV